MKMQSFLAYGVMNCIYSISCGRVGIYGTGTMYFAIIIDFVPLKSSLFKQFKYLCFAKACQVNVLIEVKDDIEDSAGAQ